MMNKKGDFTSIIMFIVLSFVITLCCGLFIFISHETKVQLHLTMDNMTTFNSTNVSAIIDETFGGYDTSLQSLYWISVIIIIAMMLSILVGSYLVTTKPIFFVPYVFLLFIAIVISVVISNAYGEILLNPTLASTFAGFIGANFILSKLPIWVSVIGIMGGIIMFSRMGSKEDVLYYG